MHELPAYGGSHGETLFSRIPGVEVLISVRIPCTLLQALGVDDMAKRHREYRYTAYDVSVEA